MKRFTKQNLNLPKIAAQIILFAGVNFRRNNYEVNYTMIKRKAYPRAKIATLNINVSTTALQNEAKFIERNRSMRIFPSQIEKKFNKDTNDLNSIASEQDVSTHRTVHSTMTMHMLSSAREQLLNQVNICSTNGSQQNDLKLHAMCS